MIKPIVRFFFRIYKIIGRWYLNPLLRFEWKHPGLKQINERAVEFGFAFKWLAKLCPEELLDVGPGTTAFPHLASNCGFHVTALDEIKGYWKGGYFNRHYYVINDDITQPKISKQFDAITCMSVLEHIPNHRDAMKGMFRLLKSGGHLILTFPYNEERYMENIYKHPEATYGQTAPFVCQVYSRSEINQWLTDNPGKIIEQEYYEVFSGELWTFGERIYPPHKALVNEKHHLTCILIQKT